MFFSSGLGRLCTKARTSRTFFASTKSRTLLKASYVRRPLEMAAFIREMISLLEAPECGSSAAAMDRGGEFSPALSAIAAGVGVATGWPGEAELSLGRGNE